MKLGPAVSTGVILCTIELQLNKPNEYNLHHSVYFLITFCMVHVTHVSDIFLVGNTK